MFTQGNHAKGVNDMLDQKQNCPDCGRDFHLEEGADVQPGCPCPSDDCPSNCLGQDDGRVGMICEDVTDGSFVMLDRPHDSWRWECAIWAGGHWSYEGDRIHLADLRRVPSPSHEMTITA